MCVCVCVCRDWWKLHIPLRSAARGFQERAFKPALWAKINQRLAFICIHVSSKYIPVCSTHRDVTVQSCEDCSRLARRDEAGAGEGWNWNWTGAFRRYGIDKRGGGRVGGEYWQERPQHTSWRERGKERSDFMLKEGDGCGPADSHVPPWGPSGAYFPLSVFSPLCRGTAVLCSPSTSGVCLASATPEPPPWHRS